MVVPVRAYTGKIWRVTGNMYGYHKVVAVAASPVGMLIQNSWGSEWDEDGYIEMSWEEFEDNKFVIEAWVSVDKKTSKHLTKKEKFRLFLYNVKSFFKTKH
jgi:hypothetical protein